MGLSPGTAKSRLFAGVTAGARLLDDVLRPVYLDRLARSAHGLASAGREEPFQRSRSARPARGAETVTLRGERAAVVLSAADYDVLTRDGPSLVDDLLSGPDWDDALAAGVDARAKSPSRDAAL